MYSLLPSFTKKIAMMDAMIDMAPSHKLTAQFLDLYAELEKPLSKAAA